MREKLYQEVHSRTAQDVAIMRAVAIGVSGVVVVALLEWCLLWWAGL